MIQVIPGIGRNHRGSDHAACLEPDGPRRLTRHARRAPQALQYNSAPILSQEEAQRVKLHRKVALAC